MHSALEGWGDEMRSAYLYRVVARAEGGHARAKMFDQLALEAESQAKTWAQQARNAGLAVPSRYQPDRRARLVAHMIGRLGPRAMRSVLAAMKVRGLSVYTHAPLGTETSAGIETNAGTATSAVIETYAGTKTSTGIEPGLGVASGAASPKPSEASEAHAGVASGGSLRAAVFGVNDGLVSNCSLILGVAGAGSDAKMVVLSGVAGLLAGAFSMAAGEYVSVRSQREMFEHQIGLEKKELELYPEEERDELALIYVARGMTDADAERLAARTLADPQRALDTLAREELGLNPDELGSPWGAAIASFAAFALGAVIPLAPFLMMRGSAALATSIVATGVALYAVGAAISLFTGRSAWRSGLRMLVIGTAAGAITYAIGRALGVSMN